MGKNIGMLKYIVFAPLARPGNFFKYGGGFVALHSALAAISSTNTMTLNVFLDAFLAYVTTKYLPPATVSDLLLPVLVGAVVAGLKWRANVW